MSQNEQDIEWYLARDGQRHGPISDPELRKFIELGHLKPTDLVWRQGFANWEQAGIVFPATAAPPRPAQPPPQPAPQAAPQPASPASRTAAIAAAGPTTAFAAAGGATACSTAGSSAATSGTTTADGCTASHGAARRPAPARPAAAEPAAAPQAAPGSGGPTARTGEPVNAPTNDPCSTVACRRRQPRDGPLGMATRRPTGRLLMAAAPQVRVQGSR